MKTNVIKRTSILLFIITLIFPCCNRADENLFWGDGEEKFDIQKIFFDERFPNVIVTTDGTVLATWGRSNYRVRRSEDGGATWGQEITVADGIPGWGHGGGVTVDESSGDIIVFLEPGTPGPFTVYRSNDDGRTWHEQEVKIFPDKKGNIPAMHMNERGITLQRSKHSGRLIRPSRSYTKGSQREFWHEHYTSAIYSDDGGKTWHASAPFPAYGTGEAALEELSDGTIYYNSRRHWAPEGVDSRRRWIAWSYDGGETWEDLSMSEELPDGDQHSDYGLMGGLVRLPLENHDILLFSNIESPEGRHHGTVWASFDGGKTWPVKRLVDEGRFAYSSMAAGREGTSSEGMIYLLYEDDGGGKIARFNLAWVTGGRDWREFLKK